MGRLQKNIIHNRILKMVFIISFIFILLIGRLYYIQIKSYNELRVDALKQRGREINLYPNRGTIYDTNLIPLTNRKRVNTLFTFKDNIYDNQNLKKFIMENAAIDATQLEEYMYSKEEVLSIPLKYSVKNMNDDKDIFITDRILRYSDQNILSHVIGYINKSENRGESGIEKVYDEILRNQPNKNYLYLELDETKNMFLGGEYLVSEEIDSIEPSGVKLTIDYHIQKIVEKVLDKNMIKGAVVVADSETGNIRALASRPNFDQDDIDGYFNRDDMVLYNKAVQVGYPPGSLFKIVVLLTALEEDINYLDKIFYCNGYEQIGDVVINCNNTEGHKYINLNQAFSRSCNSVFIQLGQELGSDKIINMAKRLGLGEKINIGLLEEIDGNLPTGEELRGPAIGNIAIGQGNIETTPIQITNLIVTIINNGIKKGLAIVDGITTEDGRIIKKFNREMEEKIVSERSCRILKEYLIDVVKKGTARNLDLDNIGGAGGKTGTAQAVLKGEEITHGWFSGFYPEEKAKYVVTVFVEEGVSGSQSAVPIFEKIIKEIYNINR